MDNFPIVYAKQLTKVKTRKTPSDEDLINLCSLLEEYEKTSTNARKGEILKKQALDTVIFFNGLTQFRSKEDMLRLYGIVGKYSETLGAHGIYDQCEKKQYFCDSLQFHMLWAESHAKLGHAQKFREILELARRRLKDVAPKIIESSFRELANQHLPEAHIFPAEAPIVQTEDVLAGFATSGPSRRKSKRVSQVALLLEEGERHKNKQLVAPLGRKGKLSIKDHFIDKMDYLAVAFEELCGAEWIDKVDAVDMDISCMPEPVPIPKIKDENDMDISVDENNRSGVPVQTPAPYKFSAKAAKSTQDEPQTRLATLTEISEHEASSEKRSRFFSPPQASRESRFSNPNTAAVTRSESPVSFRENEYNKVAAIFTDTVNLGPVETKDETMEIIPKPAEAFEVYEDPEPTLRLTSTFVAPVERRPLSEIKGGPSIETTKPDNKKPTKAFFDLDLSAIENNDPEEPTLAGQRCGKSHEKKSYGIVTSTPAPSASFGSTITPDDFFSANIDVETESTQTDDILERTGNISIRPKEMITGDINPWDDKIRNKIMKQKRTPIMQHNFQTSAPKIQRNKSVVLGGTKFEVIALAGDGGFAKVFKCVEEESRKCIALKYEVPACAWEVYVCNQLQERLPQVVTPSSRRTAKAVMEITDAYIYQNASLLVNEFLPLGTLLDFNNKLRGTGHSHLILYLAIQIATVLRDVHACQIIHGDVKPDNIMISRRVDENWDIEEILTTPVLKLIDWGRAIDMKNLPAGTSFTGKAGTANFDCPEMATGKRWNYQTDYFGFVASMHVIIFGAYCNVMTLGKNTMNQSMKRRIECREVLDPIWDRFLNIPSCDQLPSWTEAIEQMTSFFRKSFSQIEWRNAARYFNSSIQDTR